MNTEPRHALRVGLLGPTQLLAHGEELSVGGPKLRGVLAVLTLARGRLVSVDALLDAVWGEDLPATARNTLQYHVTTLRKSLGAAHADRHLVSRDPGYGLMAASDVADFGELSERGARAAASGHHDAAAAAYAEALNLWRGPALADVRDLPFAEARAVSLEAQRLTCAEAWADAELACGLADGLVTPLQELVAENPTRERLWEQLMVALYRTGRQDAALSAYRTARAALDRELGVTPSARLDAVHQAVLNHDPQLQPASAFRPPPPRPVTQTTLSRSELTSAPPTLVGPAGSRIQLGADPVVLGRQATCDMVLPDEQASRRHAQVESSDHRYVVVDLGSTNGTYVNGAKVNDRVLLTDGDRIEIGHCVIRFVAR